MTKQTRIVAWAGFLVLMLLHCDFWRAREARVVLGWMPEDLVYRLGWIALSMVYLVWFTARVWRDDESER